MTHLSLNTAHRYLISVIKVTSGTQQCSACSEIFFILFLLAYSWNANTCWYEECKSDWSVFQTCQGALPFINFEQRLFIPFQTTPVPYYREMCSFFPGESVVYLYTKDTYFRIFVCDKFYLLFNQQAIWKTGVYKNIYVYMNVSYTYMNISYWCIEIKFECI